MSEICFLDMDGVLADFISAACKWHGRDNPYANRQNHGNSQLEDLLGLDPSTFWKGLNYEFWHTIEPLPHAQELFELVSRYYDREHICILSSTSYLDGAGDGKRDWLRKHFPQLGKNFIFTSQKGLCAGPNKLLIDDFEKNTNAFKKYGGSAFLFPGKHNKLYYISDDPLSHLGDFLKARDGAEYS